MRRIQQLLRTGTTALVLCGLLSVGHSLSVRADTANAPSLVISQLKVTSSSGQFITLYNAGSSALDMSRYQLEYFNNYDLSKATSSRLIALSGIVPPHSYFMVNDGDLLLCYRLTVDSVSLGLSTTAGLVEVLAFNQSAAGGSITPVLQDYVGWSKTAAAGAQTLPSNANAFLQRQPVDVANNPAVNTPGSGTWQGVQPDSNNVCNLVGSGSSSGSSGSPIASGLNQLLPGTEPPATIIALASNDSAGVPTPVLPPADIGLMSPTITELLPNPNGTGNDATDEFIEVYNPNAASFDLSGFGLQSGTTALHNFSFPAGTTLPAQSFKVFYAADTGLSMSNSGGQVKLLDPFGSSISATSVYGTATDGQAWALANGQWYWTTSPTPGAANVINQPVPARKAAAAKSTNAKSSSKTTAAAKVKAAKTTKTKLTATGAAADDTPATTPIHLWTLALIAGLALLYGIYEYRGDLANRIYQLRRHFGGRRTNRE
jgi:hypothetical protein